MKTKATKLIFFALSAMLCFSSCRWMDDCFVPVDIEFKAIILKLNMPGTKKTRASIETPVTTVSAIVHKIDIYCYNKASEIVYFVKSLTKDELTQAASGEGLIVSQLSSNIDAIYIIANNTELKNLNVEVNGYIYTLFDKEVNINLEQDFNNITYFGKTSNLIQVAPPAGESDDIDYYIASVTIRPVVARIELSDIVCADLGTIWSTLRLNSVFVENVYMAISLNNLDDLSNINSTPFQATEVDILANNQTWWLEVLEGVNAINTITQTPWNPVINTPPESGVFVFNVFQAENLLPIIGLYFNATVNQSTRTTVNQYLKFDTYIDDDTNYESFDVGHIYKIKPKFFEHNLTILEDDSQYMTLHITVQEWTIYNNIAGTV